MAEPSAPKVAQRQNQPGGTPVKHAPLPLLCPLCPPGEARAASVQYGGVCLKHHMQGQRPPVEPEYLGVVR